MDSRLSRTAIFFKKEYNKIQVCARGINIENILYVKYNDEPNCFCTIGVGFVMLLCTARVNMGQTGTPI